MKTKILELKDDQYLSVHFNSEKLVNYIKIITNIEVKTTCCIYPDSYEEVKVNYGADFIRHGRPLDYKYCVLKVSVLPCDKENIYLLCKNVEMRQAGSINPLINLDKDNVLMISTKKSKCIEAYNEKKERYLEKHKSQKGKVRDTAFYGCHTRVAGPISLSPSCHSNVILDSFTGCHGISR